MAFMSSMVSCSSYRYTGDRQSMTTSSSALLVPTKRATGRQLTASTVFKMASSLPVTSMLFACSLMGRGSW